MHEESFMAIKILADSTCDLSPELIKRYDITLIPLTIKKTEKITMMGLISSRRISLTA
jgi:fatty acid-binding protein DegV